MRKAKDLMKKYIEYIILLIFLIYARFVVKKPLFVIAEPYGQLGNRLILFSHFIGFALSRNYEVFDPALGEYGIFFKTTKKDLLCRFPARGFALGGSARIRGIFCLIIDGVSILVKNKIKSAFIGTVELPWFGFDEEYLFDGGSALSGKEMRLDSDAFLRLIDRKRIVFIRGWRFRDNEHFQEFADVIRKYFTPIEKIQEKVDLLIEDARKHCDVLVGVHVRHADYSEWLKRRYFYGFDEYVSLMRKTERLFSGKRTGFLLCSDCAFDSDVFKDLNVKFASRHLAIDLYSLAECDYILGPPSTYSGWASFYGKVPLHWVEKPGEDISLDSFKVFNLLRGVEIELTSGERFIM